MRRNGVPKARKSVPQNFGFMKRPNSSSTAAEMQASVILSAGRTAHVSAVQRNNKLKVSGGTQTTVGDFQQPSKLRVFNLILSQTRCSFFMLKLD